MGDVMNKQHTISDSELAKAIESSPYHQAMLHSDDSSIARFGAEAEHLADDMRELLREVTERIEADCDEDEGPTLLYQRVGGHGNWFQS